MHCALMAKVGGAVALALLGLPWGWAADASACAAHLQPRWGEGAVALTSLGLRQGQAADVLAHAICLRLGWREEAVVLASLGLCCWLLRAKWEGGQHVAQLALVSIGEALGVVR